MRNETASLWHALFPWLMGILYAGWLLIFVLPQRTVGYYGVETDFYAFYGPQAKAALRGEVFVDEFHPPLFGWMIAGLSFWTGEEPFRAAMRITAWSAGLLLVLGYKIAALIFDRKTAFWAMLLVASSPTFFAHAYAANIHLPFAVICLLAAWGILTERWFLAVVAIAAACWMRWNGMLLLIPVALSGHRLRIWAVAAVGLILLGWWSGVHYGGIFHNRNWENLAWGLYGDREASLWHDPLQMMLSALRNFFNYGGRLLFFGLAVPIGALALGSLDKLRLDAHTLMLAVSFPVLCLIHWGDHFSLLFLPYLAALAANTVLRCCAQRS